MHYEKCNLKNHDNFMKESYEGDEWQEAMDSLSYGISNRLKEALIYTHISLFNYEI